MPQDRAEDPAGATAVPVPGGREPAGGREEPTGRSARRSNWWLVAPAFVVGLFAGAITLGVLREDPPPVPATAVESPAGSDAGDSAGGGGAATPGATAEFAVNEACLRVVNGTEDLVDVIGDLGSAAADLDISGLDQAIRELQPLERRLREDLEGCETETTLPEDLSPVPGGPESPEGPDSSDGTGSPDGTGSSESPASPSTTAPPD